MRLIRRAGNLYRLFFQRGKVEGELDAEVRAYFEVLVDRYRAQGLSIEEAQRVAQVACSGPEQVKQRVRDARAGAMLDSISRDIGYALRTIRRSPGFATVTILTLALGIGANTAIFSVIFAVLLRPLPYHEPNRLALLFQTGGEEPREQFLLPDLKLVKAQSRSFEDVAIYYKNTGFSLVTLTGITEPETVQGAYVSANLFPLLGEAPSMGRTFTAQEEAQGERVVVLTHRLWGRRFASTGDLSGKTLEIDGASFRVIGVMPPDFQFPARDSEFWAPLTTNPSWLDWPINENVHTRGFYARWNAVVRLKPGIPFSQAQAEMKTLAPRLEQRDPYLNKGLGLSVNPLQVEVSGNTRLAFSILVAAVGCLLLISCANAAHLMLARGAGRAQEIAVRIALGAARADLIRQLLTESVVLALLAGCGGLLLAAFGVRALVAYGPENIPRLEQATLDPEALVFAFGISLFAAILFGLLPAWRTSRDTPNDALKSGGRSSAGGAALSRTRGWLVVMEFALTVVLLTGAGLLIRSFLAVQAVDPGFDPQHVLTLRVALPSGARHAGFYDQVLERIKSVPGVRAVGAISGGLFDLNSSGRGGANDVEPPRIVRGRLRVWAEWKSVRGDYLAAMGMPLLRGRSFHSQDGPNAPLVAIIDRNMARRYWPGQDAIGKQFRGQDKRGHDDDPLTVIGVVGDTHNHGRDREPTSHIFQPITQSQEEVTRDLVVRTDADPTKLAASVREIVRSLDRTAIISGVTTMEQQLDEQTSPRRFQTWLLSLFSLLALVLASVGIYGVMHYAVMQRTREIGIRMALGAHPGTVLAMVMKQGLMMVLPALAAGLAGAYWLTHLLASMLFGVKPADPAMYASVALLLTGVAMAAISIPSWRAAKVDPLEALRQE